MNSIGTFTALAALALTAMSASAQDRRETAGGWEVNAAAYLWLPESRTTVSLPYGDVSTKLSASDAVDALDFGTMLAVNARRGDWALLGDLFYLDLTLDGPSPLGILYSGAEARTRLTSLSGYGLYTFHDRNGLRVEGGGGLRLMSSDIDVTLHGNVVADRQSSISDSWVDPVLAVRATTAFTDRVNGSLFLDAGGFGIGSSSDRTWQLAARVDWQINDKWTLGAGYRTLYVEREKYGVPYNLRMSGPVLGLAVKF